MKTKIQNFWNWYRVSSFPLGLICMGVLTAYAARATIATITCTWNGSYCQYAISAREALADSMSEILETNPQVEIRRKPQK